jgi:LAO/AO transport system kinase
LQALTFGEPQVAVGWQPPVIRTSAVTREGIADLVQAIGDHRQWLAESGELEVRLRRVAATQLAARVQHDLMSEISGPTRHSLFATMVDEILAKAITPQRASQLLLALISHEEQRG